MTTETPAIINVRTMILHTDNSAPIPGERLCTLRWKTPKEKMADPSYKKFPNLCVSIPRVSFSVTPTDLTAALTEAVEEIQDTIIREYVENKLEAGEAATSIGFSLELLTPEKIAEWHKSKNSAGRLSKEKLEAWYSANLADRLMYALSQVMKLSDNATPEQLKALETATEQHKKAIIGLASPRAAMNANVATQLQKAINLAETDSTDKIKTALIEKLEAFTKPQDVVLSLNL